MTEPYAYPKAVAQSATPTYTPKVGDRVRVTYEGTIDWVSRNGFDFSIGENDYVELNMKGAEIEKLRDPEPDWADGDVIRVTPYIPAYRIKGEWLTSDGRSHRFPTELSLSEHWQRGRVHILLKEDA